MSLLSRRGAFGLAAMLSLAGPRAAPAAGRVGSVVAFEGSLLRQVGAALGVREEALPRDEGLSAADLNRMQEELIASCGDGRPAPHGWDTLENIR